ncbi:hypothetical protein ACUL41_03450 [Virgibacillus natechei]
MFEKYHRFISIVSILVLLIFALNVPVVVAENDESNVGKDVVPIQWENFETNLSGDEELELLNEIMSNSTHYIVNTWYEENNYDEVDDYINFGGKGEFDIRGPGMAALGIAVPIATGNYNEDKIDLSEDEAKHRAIHLITSLAHQHRTNTSDGWGGIDQGVQNDWQTPLWSYYTGFAAWLLWDDLSIEDQQNVQRMIEWEANNIPEPRYYQNEQGEILNDGNTQAEENSSWASLLGLASAMMPNHPNVNKWEDQMIDLAISSYSRPDDIQSDEVVNGRELSDVLDGSNIMNDGTVVNHGIRHPIYMLSFEQNINVALTSSLAGQETPEAIFHNADIVYHALTDIEFESPEYAAPGGTIYREDSSEIYYPEGNDWGGKFPFYFGQIDVLANVFEFDHLSNSNASTWSKLHNEEALRMQERFDDGRTYKNDEESNYELREERIAQIAGSTFLAKWIKEQGLFQITDRAYEKPSTSDGGELPNTNSGLFLNMYTGIAIILVGFVLVYYNRKKQSKS